MPKFMLLFFGSYADYDRLPEEAKRKQYDAVDRWWSENGRHLRGGEQAKEGIGGFAIVDVADKQAAIEIAKGWPAGGVEVRPIVEGR